MDASEALDNDCATTEVSGLESGVLAAASLTVVHVTNGDPWDASGLVATGDGGHGVPFTRGAVADLVGGVVLAVDGAVSGKKGISFTL